LTGEGKATYGNGDQYEGKFLAGNKNGPGTIRYAAGGEYKGDFVDNQITGQGRKVYKNGDIYTGNFLNGQRHGEGEYFMAKFGSTSKGVYIRDKKQNEGNRDMMFLPTPSVSQIQKKAGGLVKVVKVVKGNINYVA